MKEKICSFFGHRNVDITETLKEKTFFEIKKAIEYGCKIFYFGGYGDFDELCYNIVSKIKEDNKEIVRIYCVARETFLYKKTRYFNREDYEQIIFLQPSFNGWYKSIYFRNCAMIDNSDYIIFFANEKENSGAFKAYHYAKKQKYKQIVNILNNYENG